MVKQFFLMLLFSLTSIHYSFAQPSNDNCEGAINLTNLSNWCSASGQYTTAGATSSGYGSPTCGGDYTNDVWFRFTAQARDLTVTVIGNQALGSGGTMTRPNIAMYIVNACGGTINEMNCATSGSQNAVDMYEGGLIIGQTYYFRIGTNGATGSFQLCMNNYNQPAQPGSDCSSAAVLCDTSPFTVQSVTSAGNNPDEAAGSCLSGGGNNSESNSTWFKWIADNNGSLNMTLTPNNPSDDLDFVIYELPNGINSCGGKNLVRCQASGSPDFPSPCMGPTGMRPGAGDTSEPPGCDSGRDAWLAPLQLVAGRAYALLVNNYTSSGNGFSITWGGSGQFRGSTPDFTLSPTTICAGGTVTVTDNSSSAIGNITTRDWSFPNATPSTTGTGIGPFSLTYTSPGNQSVALTVRNSLGCIITHVETITVDPCCQTINAISLSGTASNMRCADNTDGTISTTSSSPTPYNALSYSWSNGATTPSLTQLNAGTYTVTVVSAICATTSIFTIQSPPAYSITQTITKPTCGGGQDGAISLAVSGATPPYTYFWANGNTTNSLTNIPIGDYNVTITDANACTIARTIEVRELELELTGEPATNPTCFGFSNGSIIMNISNGLAPYQYNFGNGFSTNNSFTNLPTGTYPVTVRDANLCETEFTYTITAPPIITISLTPVSVSCFGDTDGTITSSVGGGVPAYTYQWVIPLIPTQTTPDLANLPPGIYTVTVTDTNLCTMTASAEVIEPAELYITDIQVIDNICAGDNNGQLTVIAGGGTSPYTYSTDGTAYQTSIEFANLLSGTYTVSVQDSRECVVTQTATISEPPPIIPDAGIDQTVILGESTPINATWSPFGRPVTWAWSPATGLSDATIRNPIATPYNTTTYTVTITDETGCTGTDIITIFVDKNYPVFIPNAFTPNNDGDNDYFIAYSGKAGKQITNIQIFDRWGGVMYVNQNIPLSAESRGWDGTFKGKPLNPGVYVYLIEIEFLDGIKKLYSGDITLIK